MGIGTGLATWAAAGDQQTRNDDFSLTAYQAPAQLERETGIEPASLAWKAKVLPLNYSREGAIPFSCFALVEEVGFEPT